MESGLRLRFEKSGFVIVRHAFDPRPLVLEVDRALRDGFPDHTAMDRRGAPVTRDGSARLAELGVFDLVAAEERPG